MRLEGERLLSLVSEAQSRVILCAPFIKVRTLEALLQVIPDSVELEIITRWRAREVAAGVTDLEVFELVKGRRKSELRLLDSLHAKLYVADKKCLVGSANITAAALGWAKAPNVELLVEESLDHPSIEFLMSQLTDATPATYQLKTEVEAEAAELAKQSLDDLPKPDEGDPPESGQFWLPQCAAPEKLYAVYSDAPSPVVTAGTKDDAQQDLIDLGLPRDLGEGEFKRQVASALQRMPSFHHILDRIPAKLTDEAGQDLIRPFVSDLSDTDLTRQWHIVREWISVFFADRFELAPETYVLRLRPGHKGE